MYRFFLVVFATLALWAQDGEPFAPLAPLMGSWHVPTTTHTLQFETLYDGSFIRLEVKGNEEPFVGFFSYQAKHEKHYFHRFLHNGSVNSYHLEVTAKSLKFHPLNEGSDPFGIQIIDELSFVLHQPNRAAITVKKLDPKNWTEGVDVSHFSGKVDWKAVAKAGYRYAFIKATEGEDWVDPTYKGHMVAAKEAGLIRGAYHFFIAHDDPIVQANWFIKNVQLESGDFAPVVDVETLSNRPVPDLDKRLSSFISLLKEHYKVTPIIYTSPHFWNHNLKEAFKAPLWVAEYGRDLPEIPKNWTSWDIWQYDGDTTISGVEKTADVNYFNGQLDQLKYLRLP